jgi:hypothetical protein
MIMHSLMLRCKRCLHTVLWLPKKKIGEAVRIISHKRVVEFAAKYPNSASALDD